MSSGEVKETSLLALASRAKDPNDLSSFSANNADEKMSLLISSDDTQQVSAVNKATLEVDNQIMRDQKEFKVNENLFFNLKLLKSCLKCFLLAVFGTYDGRFGQVSTEKFERNGSN